MPTLLPRFQVTQTDDVARALDVAANEWPDANRPELVTRLLQEGAAAIEHRRDESTAGRRRALAETRGLYAYPAGSLDELRAEWDE
ncbi:MAG: hypothetical protein ACTHZX_03235 [Microbacterium sp.]